MIEFPLCKGCGENFTQDPDPETYGHDYCLGCIPVVQERHIAFLTPPESRTDGQRRIVAEDERRRPLSEDRATYRTKDSILTIPGLDHVIWRVGHAFPQASWEIAKSVIRRKGEFETEYWAEIALDRERGIEFDAYGDSPASALLAALALAEKAEAA